MPADNQRHGPELADILRLYGSQYLENYKIPFEHAKVMSNILMCRTSMMGGHVDICDHCDFTQNSYNSCGDRHCPKCQTLSKEKWLNARKAELLPTGYFHLVFTLPHDLNPIILCNKRILLGTLFSAVNETLQAFAGDPQWRLVGQLGFIAVLHTWSQTLMDHFHLHCLIPAGVLSFEKDRWIPSRAKFLFRAKSLAKEFRKRYISHLEILYSKNEIIFPGNTARTGSPEGFEELINTISHKKWIVYAKRPFAGPEQVLEYLGRYAHRVAISNNRIASIDGGKVTFSYKDRIDDNKTKSMTLKADEFIRRFLLHVLPKRFMKIRYFGFMYHREKRKNIELIRKFVDPDRQYTEKTDETVLQIMLRLTGEDVSLCPNCGKGHMIHTIKIPKGTVFHKKSKRTAIDST